MPIFSVGHSSHSAERFFELIAPFHITHIIDVRSKPFSKWVPHFNKENFKKLAENHGYKYEWWGETLGGFGRKGGADDIDHPVDVYYGETLGGSGRKGDESFQKAIEKLSIKFGESSESTAVIVCAEKDPTECHRSNLIGSALRALPETSVDIQHILPDGNVVRQSSLEERGKVSRKDRSGTMSLFDE